MLEEMPDLQWIHSAYALRQCVSHSPSTRSLLQLATAIRGAEISERDDLFDTVVTRKEVKNK